MVVARNIVDSTAIPSPEKNIKPKTRSGYGEAVRSSSLKSLPLMNHKDEFKYYPMLFF